MLVNTKAKQRQILDCFSLAKLALASAGAEEPVDDLPAVVIAHAARTEQQGVTGRSRRAALWWGCWRSLMIAPAKPNSPRPSTPNSMPEDCPISKRSAGASHRIQPPFPTSPSRWRRSTFMTSSALSRWLLQHENDR